MDSLDSGVVDGSAVVGGQGGSLREGHTFGNIPLPTDLGIAQKLFHLRAREFGLVAGRLILGRRCHRPDPQSGDGKQRNQKPFGFWAKHDGPPWKQRLS